MKDTLSAKDREFILKLSKAVQENTDLLKEHDKILKSLKTNKITLERTPIGGIQINYPDQIIQK